MSAEKHSYEPVRGHGLRHDPFNAIIGPRPIGWISSISAAGIANLAPYSYFNAFNYFPPIIGFSTIGWKDSVSNIAQTREFGWNLTTRALAQQMNLTCAPAPPEGSEPAMDSSLASAGTSGLWQFQNARRAILGAEGQSCAARVPGQRGDSGVGAFIRAAHQNL